MLGPALARLIHDGVDRYQCAARIVVHHGRGKEAVDQRQNAGARHATIRRREFIGIAGGAAAWPLAAHAQKAMPVIGYLSSRSLSDSQDIIAAFHQGLSEAGFVDKQNVLIEYRFAEFNFDRLSGLAAELVRRQINVLVATGGTVSAVKAKLVLPTTIPMQTV